MKSEKNYNGLWMLVGLVALLSLPMAIGYFTLLPVAEAPLHANASN